MEVELAHAMLLALLLLSERFHLGFDVGMDARRGRGRGGDGVKNRGRGMSKGGPGGTGPAHERLDVTQEA